MSANMNAPTGTVKEIATASNFAHTAGNKAYFSPNGQLAPTLGDIRALLIELNATPTGSSAVNVQGLLGALANLTITDGNNKNRYNFTGPQLAYWHYLMLRKANPSPAVASITEQFWRARLPVKLPQSGGPYAFYATAAPYAEVAGSITGLTSNLTVSAEYGPVMGNGEILDFTMMPAGLAVGTNDISLTLPLGVQYSSLAFVLNADSDFNWFDWQVGTAQVYAQQDFNYFAAVAFDANPATEPSTDVRPSGLIPIPFSPYARSNADRMKLNLNAVNTAADPTTGVSLGSSYNPYCWLTRQSL